MRLRELIPIALIACRGDKPAAPPPPQPAPAPVPAAADAAPAAPLVELLHAVPAVVKLSSQVDNATIKPEHLVDHDLNTAWNSRTGELVGAWIEVTLPAGATAEEVRLTVGHTGHGPKGEDYFTMNPRITEVSVLRGDTVLGRYPLDPNNRELQKLKLHAQGTLRIRVDRVKMGSNKAWRETCVSELEVWGTLPPGTQAQALKPSIEVEPPPPPPSAFDKLCAGLDDAKKQWEARVHAEVEGCADLPPDQQVGCGVDPPGPPDCHVSLVDISSRAAPWKEVAVHEDISDSVYHLGSIEVLVRANNDVITAETIDLEGMPVELDNLEAAVEHGALVIRYDKITTENPVRRKITCQAGPKPTCKAGP